MIDDFTVGPFDDVALGGQNEIVLIGEAVASDACLLIVGLCFHENLTFSISPKRRTRMGRPVSALIPHLSSPSYAFAYLIKAHPGGGCPGNAFKNLDKTLKIAQEKARKGFIKIFKDF